MDRAVLSWLVLQGYPYPPRGGFLKRGRESVGVKAKPNAGRGASSDTSRMCCSRDGTGWLKHQGACAGRRPRPGAREQDRRAESAVRGSPLAHARASLASQDTYVYARSPPAGPAEHTPPLVCSCARCEAGAGLLPDGAGREGCSEAGLMYTSQKASSMFTRMGGTPPIVDRFCVLIRRLCPDHAVIYVE